MSSPLPGVKRRGLSRVLTTLAAVGVAALMAGCAATPETEPTAATSSATSAAPSSSAAESAIEAGSPTTALAALAAVPVKGRAPKTGYDRDLYGSGWVDVDRNGCD